MVGKNHHKGPGTPFQDRNDFYPKDGVILGTPRLGLLCFVEEIFFGFLFFTCLLLVQLGLLLLQSLLLFLLGFLFPTSASLALSSLLVLLFFSFSCPCRIMWWQRMGLGNGETYREIEHIIYREI